MRELVAAIEPQLRTPRYLSPALHGIALALVDEEERISDLNACRLRNAQNRRLILVPGQQRSIGARDADDGIPGMIRICCVHSRWHTGIIDDAAAPAAGSVDSPMTRR